MRKIKKGDEVVVLTGKDKGKHGKVLRMVGAGERLVVTGINMIKKHMRPNPQRSEQGGIVEREASLHISNVAIVNPSNGKADKVRIKIQEDGKRVRVFKSSGELVEV